MRSEIPVDQNDIFSDRLDHIITYVTIHSPINFSPFADFEVDDEEYHAQEDTDAADNEVSDAEERVLASEPRGRCQDEALSSVKHGHGVV